MSVHIDEVLEYLDSHMVCRHAQGMPALMAALREAYSLHDEGTASGDPELTAFSQGVLTGMMLMTEVNRVP